MRVLVFGYGRMGQAIKHALTVLGHNVYTCDSPSSGLNADWLADFSHPSAAREVINKYDFNLVVSSLPYFLNKEVAEAAFEKGVAYCDLGGHVGTSKKINDLAQKMGGQAFTDLGLAPGLVNILGEGMVMEMGDLDYTVDKLNMYCGGIPLWVGHHGPFDYFCTWSSEGLINEYADDCVILQGGLRKKVPGMSGYQTLRIGDQEYEAFYTSGGAAHTIDTLEDNVPNVSYRTLRYPGHHKVINYCIHNTDMTNESVAKMLEAEKPNIIFGRDVVIVKVEAVSECDTTLSKTLKLEPDYKNGFTAMQRATAYSLASVAHMMLEGRQLARYSQVANNYGAFCSTLRKLGIEL